MVHVTFGRVYPCAPLTLCMRAIRFSHWRCARNTQMHTHQQDVLTYTMISGRHMHFLVNNYTANYTMRKKTALNAHHSSNQPMF